MIACQEVLDVLNYHCQRTVNVLEVGAPIYDLVVAHIANVSPAASPDADLELVYLTSSHSQAH